jgi:hypothetical protein
MLISPKGKPLPEPTLPVRGDRFVPCQQRGRLRRTRWMWLAGIPYIVPLGWTPRRRHLRYRYLGDALTRPELRGMECDPVRRRDGKCIVSTPMASAMVIFATGERAVVLRRRLRLRRPNGASAT